MELTFTAEMFPHVSGAADLRGEIGTVQLFGLTKVLPVDRPQIDDQLGGLSLCPDRQITVTEAGEPFIHAPSMKSAFETVSQTQEDMQLATDKDNDTD
ncbi:putative ATP-grasp-modified RiPP [Streptomyces sp. NPDC059568]|uniref:putative ATP-grasp-modified RiPP n=1 Tax=Streptomyces sp. NPDC059568 TaxID=3346868 RepID=UPI00367E3727